MTGLAGLMLPAVKVVGRSNDTDLLASKEEYGDFLIRRESSDNPPYEVDALVYRRFNQRNTVFCRTHWDPKIQEAEAPYRYVSQERMKNNNAGFTRLDYAFYNAAWTVAGALGSNNGSTGWANGGLFSWQPLRGARTRLGDPWNPSDWSPEEVSKIVKKAAKFYGASLSGIAKLDERWIYSHRYNEQARSRNENPPAGQEPPIVFEDVDHPLERGDKSLVIPRSMKYVVSLAFEMDYDGMETSIGGPASAATGNGYSRMTFTAACLAEFVRALGYNAIPSGNCTGLSIPVAIDAGLGELGRLGLLITPKFGPRVRLAKVITDMPLIPDHPISFGVTEFCEICGKCAKECPGNAISENSRTFDPIDISNNSGICRWPINQPNCHLMWRQQGMDCSVCIRVCPFNKPETWVHELSRILIGVKSGPLDKLLLKLDDATSFGKREDPRSFWKKNNFIHL
jgi:reductive dehalogenase